MEETERDGGSLGEKSMVGEMKTEASRELRKGEVDTMMEKTCATS